MKEMNQQELTQALESEGKSLVVFLYTPLCGTCKAARRMLEVAEYLLPDEVVIAEANVNMLPQIVGRYHISSVPALLAVTSVRSQKPEMLYAMGSVEQVLHFIRRVTS